MRRCITLLALFILPSFAWGQKAQKADTQWVNCSSWGKLTGRCRTVVAPKKDTTACDCNPQAKAPAKVPVKKPVVVAQRKNVAKAPVKPKAAAPLDTADIAKAMEGAALKIIRVPILAPNPSIGVSLKDTLQVKVSGTVNINVAGVLPAAPAKVNEDSLRAALMLRIPPKKDSVAKPEAGTEKKPSYFARHRKAITITALALGTAACIALCKGNVNNVTYQTGQGRTGGPVSGPNGTLVGARVPLRP